MWNYIPVIIFRVLHTPFCSSGTRTPFCYLNHPLFPYVPSIGSTATSVSSWDSNKIHIIIYKLPPLLYPVLMMIMWMRWRWWGWNFCLRMLLNRIGPDIWLNAVAPSPLTCRYMNVGPCDDDALLDNTNDSSSHVYKCWWWLLWLLPCLIWSVIELYYQWWMNISPWRDNKNKNNIITKSDVKEMD